ncbi:hypothetical protein S245_051733, partial [Arachis hypogaea]
AENAISNIIKLDGGVSGNPRTLDKSKRSNSEVSTIRRARDRALSPCFEAIYGHKLGSSCYAIDEWDNCLVLDIESKNKQKAITKGSFELIRDFYFVGRGNTIQFTYAGFGIFFISLFNEMNQPIKIFPDKNFYVGDRLDQNTLHNVKRVFHLDYSSNSDASSPNVMILSGFEPSKLQDSSDEDKYSTMEGNNPNNPIIMCDESNSIIELSEDSSKREEIPDNRYNPQVSYRKTLTRTDMTGSRLYVGASFAAHLTPSEHSSIWQIAGPSSSRGNIFFFIYLKVKEEIQNGNLGWIGQNVVKLIT